MANKNSLITYGGLGLFGIFGPVLFPEYTLSIAYLWMMVLMASTWDTLGGQMGYNSLRQHRVLWRRHVCFSHRSNIILL